MKYDTYEMNKREMIVSMGIGIILLVTVGKLFYGRFWVGIIFAPSLIGVKRFSCDLLRQKRKQQLKKQFGDFVTALSDAMKVGFSVENGLKECLRDISMLYGKDCIMSMEIRDMIRRISLNEKVDKLFVELSNRANISEITLFAQVYSIARRSGGKVNQLMEMVAGSINDSFVVDEEIEVAINDKKTEQLVMSFVPPGIIVYLWLTSPELVNRLHNSFIGIAVMTVCLAIYVFALYLAYRIINRGDLND